MRSIDTFYVRHQVPPGETVESVARWAVEDLHQGAQQIGIKLISEPQARVIPEGPLPQVEAWAHIPPRITRPKPPVFKDFAHYVGWRSDAPDVAA